MGDVQHDDGAGVLIDPVANAPVRSAAGGILPGLLILQRMSDAVRFSSSGPVRNSAAVAISSGNRAS
jgi:hypothetical protein